MCVENIFNLIKLLFSLSCFMYFKYAVLTKVLERVGNVALEFCQADSVRTMN